MTQLALSSWSLHTVFLNSRQSRITATYFPRLAREQFGVDTIEFFDSDYFAGGILSPHCDLKHAEDVKRECQKYDLKIACISAINDLIDDEKNFQKDLTSLSEWVQHCKVLECPWIRLNSGGKPLTNETVDLYVERLGRLLEVTDQLDRSGDVGFVVENHPFVIGKSEAQCLREIVRRAGDDRVKLLPDLGAMKAGFWKAGIELLAEYAAHIHVKPAVIDENGNEIPIAEYGPVTCETLEAAGFDGAISIEFTEFRDLGTEPRQATLSLINDVAKAFQISSHEPVPIPSNVQTKNQIANTNLSVLPDEEILRALIDRCSQQTESPAQFNELESRRRVVSSSHIDSTEAVDAETPIGDTCVGSSTNSFCSLIGATSEGRKECQNFHKAKVQRVTDGRQTHPAICFCPFGLSVASVPVIDQNADVVYGLLSAGPWLERGTEGMILSGIERFDSDLQSVLTEASLATKEFNVRGISETVELLSRYSTRISTLYSATSGDFQVEQLRRRAAEQLNAQATRMVQHLRAIQEKLHRHDADGVLALLGTVVPLAREVADHITESVRDLQRPVVRRRPLYRSQHLWRFFVNLRSPDVPFDLDTERPMAKLPAIECDVNFTEFVFRRVVTTFLSGRTNVTSVSVGGVTSVNPIVTDWSLTRSGQRIIFRGRRLVDVNVRDLLAEIRPFIESQGGQITLGNSMNHDHWDRGVDDVELFVDIPDRLPVYWVDADPFQWQDAREIIENFSSRIEFILCYSDASPRISEILKSHAPVIVGAPLPTLPVDIKDSGEMATSVRLIQDLISSGIPRKNILVFADETVDSLGDWPAEFTNGSVLDENIFRKDGNEAVRLVERLRQFMNVELNRSSIP